MPKTGSSALQSTLVLNRDELARQGVNYPEHSSDAEAALGNVSSGNGGPLRPLVETRLREQAGAARVTRARDRLVEMLSTTPADTVLYSQERFFQYDPDLLGELDSLVGDLGVELGVIVYVRDVAPYVESIYGQLLKRRRRYVGSLTDFVSDYIQRSDPHTFPLTRERIESAAQVLGPGRLHVMHYETERDRLAESLLVDTLGVECDTLDLGVRHVNRALTHREVLWMRVLSEKLTVVGSARLASNQIMAQPPQDDARLGVDAEDLRRLENAFGADIDWINDAFFPDRRLAIGTCRAAAGPTPVTLTEAETRLLEVMAGLADHAAREERAVPPPIEKELQRLRRTARRQRRQLERLEAQLAEATDRRAGWRARLGAARRRT